MFRRFPPPRSCFIAVVSLVLCAAPLSAGGQDLSTQERLDRLERDLNMLQRQVYRGAPPPAMAAGGGAVNTEVRMERLEAEMRELTGRIEELGNEVRQVHQRVEQINSDVETRFTQSGAEPAGGDRSAPPFPPPGVSDEAPVPPRRSPGAAAALMPPGTIVPPTSGPAGAGTGPTPIFGTLRPPGAAPAPPAELAGTPSGPHPVAGVLPSGSATEQYNHAFGLLKKADYPAAEAALKAFIAAHPRDPMAGNAQYWLGETYYTHGKYLEAASAFAEGYQRYPKSSKAADGLLKMGMALARADQKKNACLAFAQLDRDFPHAAAAVRERAGAEKKRLGC